MATRYIKIRGRTSRAVVKLPIIEFDGIPTRYGKYSSFPNTGCQYNYYGMVALKEGGASIQNSIVQIFAEYCTEQNPGWVRGGTDYTETFDLIDNNGSVITGYTCYLYMNWPTGKTEWPTGRVFTKGGWRPGKLNGEPNIYYYTEAGAWKNLITSGIASSFYNYNYNEGNQPFNNSDYYQFYLRFNTPTRTSTTASAANSIFNYASYAAGNPWGAFANYKDNGGAERTIANADYAKYFRVLHITLGMAKYKDTDGIIKNGPVYVTSNNGNPLNAGTSGGFWSNVAATNPAMEEFINNAFNTGAYEEQQTSGAGGGTSTPEGGGGTIGEGGTGGDVSGDLSVGTYPTATAGRPLVPDSWSSVLSSKFISAYVVSNSDLNTLATRLWSNTFVDKVVNLLKDMDFNLWERIVSLKKFPFFIVETGLQDVTAFGVSLETQLPVVVDQYITVDMGSVTVPEYWGSFLDYHSGIEMFIPFVGVVDLNPSDVIGSRVTLKYVCDILTGDALARVTVSRAAKGGVAEVKDIELYNFPCNMSHDIPLSSNSNAAAMTSGAAAAGGGVAAYAKGMSLAGNAGWLSGAEGSTAIAAGGGAAAVGLGLAGIGMAAFGISSMNRDSAKRSGNLTGNTGFLGKLTASIIISRPIQVLPKNYANTVGYPSMIGGKVSDFSGFTTISSWTPAIPGATATEIDMLNTIVQGGIIV